MEDYIALIQENAILEKELEQILAILFNSVETDSYISPFGIFAYLKAVYPDRWKKKMEYLYPQEAEK